MQHKLGAVASVMQEEQDTAKRENQLRDAVFQADTMLRTLRKGSKDNPSASLAWARHNLLQFERNEVTSASFRSYEDKERLRSLVEGHEQLIQECVAGLSPQQQDQAKRCGQYLVERADLDLLIDLKKRQEQLQESKLELEGLTRTEKKGVEGYDIGIAAWGLMLLLFSSFPTLANERDFLGIPGRYFFCGGIALILVFAIRMTIKFKTGGGEGFRHGAEAASRKQAVEAKVKKLEATADPTLIQMLQQRVGSSPVAGLQAMRNDREALIVDVLGDSAKGFIDRDQPSVARLYDVALVAVPAEKKVAIINAIRDVLPGLSLAEAKSTAEILPALLLCGVSKAQADTAGDALVNAGARVEITAGM